MMLTCPINEDDFYAHDKVSIDYDTAEEKRDKILNNKNWRNNYD